MDTTNSLCVWFITHPDVVIDPTVPVTDWKLSSHGLSRMRGLLNRGWVPSVGAIWSSNERKARDGAAVLSDALGMPYSILSELGENDRSATGYLPRAAFETVADAFFANPDQSVHGWERAIDAQARIVAAVETVLIRSPADVNVAIVAHGGVGALLLCHLRQQPISRAADQPATNGGNYFAFDRASRSVRHLWRAIDGCAAAP